MYRFARFEYFSLGDAWCQSADENKLLYCFKTATLLLHIRQLGDHKWLQQQKESTVLAIFH